MNMDVATVVTMCSVAIIFAFAVSLYFANNPKYPPVLGSNFNTKGNTHRSRRGMDYGPEAEYSRSPTSDNRTSNRRGRRQQSDERDFLQVQEILKSVSWRDELNKLCEETSFQEGDFDPRSLRLLEEYHADGVLENAWAALRESVENQPRNNILNTRRYVYTLLRRVDRDVYGKFKLKTREERATRQRETPDKPKVTTAEIRELLGHPTSEPREDPPATRTKSNVDSPGKLHEFNPEAEEFTPGNRSHGCVEFIPGAISHGVLHRTAMMPGSC